MQYRASAPVPNWRFNADANSGHASGIFMPAVCTLRLRLWRRLTWGLERMNTPAPNGDSAGVVAPAPIFFVIASAIGAVLEWLHPSTLLAQPYARFVGAILIAISMALFAAVLVQMARAKTSFDANKPTSTLITSGVFRVCRNPTYLSLVLLQAGLAFAFQSLWLLLLVVPAVAVTHWGVVVREEQFLKRKFGSEYVKYARRVRRWL